MIRRGSLLALLLAVALHGGALLLLIHLVEVAPAPEAAAPTERVELAWVESSPSDVVDPAPASEKAPRVEGPPVEPRRKRPRAQPPRTPRRESLGGSAGDAQRPPSPPPPVGDDPISDEDLPFPRHAYGEPPPPPPRPSDDVEAPAEAARPPAAPKVTTGERPDAAPRAAPRRSLLDRVTQGLGPAAPGGDVVGRLVREAPPVETDADRAAASVRRIAGLSSTPDDGLTGRRLRYDEALEPVKGGGFAYKAEGWQARIFPDGNVVFDGDVASYEPGAGHPLWDALGIPNADLTSGTFDATDALMRIAKQDPYAAAKQCFLDDTEPIRDELRAAFQKKRLEEAIAQLGDRLDGIWAEARPAAERRAAIFALYDGCSSEEAGQLARRVILTWVRTRLPAGSPHAFPLDELLSLNEARGGEALFDPYGNVADAGVSGG